jgi:hypothetical protein
MAIGFIAGFLVFNEILKAKPFGTLKAAVKEDAAYIKDNRAEVFSTIKKIATAPLIGLAYVVSLPFAFAYAIGAALGRAAAPALSFGWRPVEAYFTGRKKRSKK